MQDTLRALRGLQELDQDIYRVDQEVQRLPRELERRSAEIQGRKDRRQELEREHLQKRAAIKEIEDHTSIQRQRIRKLEKEANEARADAAMQAAFQHEIKSLRRDIGEAEEEGLRMVDEAETIAQAMADLDETIEAEQKDFDEYEGNVRTELAAATEKLEGLQAERRKRMSDSIPPDVLAIYESLLQAREGLAMTELDNRVCQGCFMNVPTNVYVRIARAQEVVQCPNCSRILYLAGSL